MLWWKSCTLMLNMGNFRARGCEADNVEERVEFSLHCNGINNHPDDSPSDEGQREQMGHSLD